MKSAATTEFEEQHTHNMHILGLIRDEPAWALSRILRCERLEAALAEIADLPEGVGPYSGMQKFAREALNG